MQADIFFREGLSLSVVMICFFGLVVYDFWKYGWNEDIIMYGLFDLYLLVLSCSKITMYSEWNTKKKHNKLKAKDLNKFFYKEDNGMSDIDGLSSPKKHSIYIDSEVPYSCNLNTK